SRTATSSWSASPAIPGTATIRPRTPGPSSRRPTSSDLAPQIVTFAASIGTDLLRAVLQGAPPGTVYALIALGFVLAYKTSGVFNLAFGAPAYISAIAYYKTHAEWEWGIIPSLVVSVLLPAPLLGFVLEWVVFRHLRTAPAVAKLVVTIGLAVALPNLAEMAFDFAPVIGRTPQGIVPDGSTVFYDPFGVYA